MGTQGAPKLWWERLDLGRALAAKVAELGTETPAQLAGMARGNPDDFRHTFGAKARAELAQALTAHLAEAKTDTEGYGNLLAALEELDGTRSPGPRPQLPDVGFGVVLPAPSVPVQPVPPLHKLGPGGRRLPPPKND